MAKAPGPIPMAVNMSANFGRIRCTGRASILSRTGIGMPVHSRLANSMAKVRTRSPMVRRGRRLAERKALAGEVCRCVGTGNRAVHRRNLVRQLTDCEVRRLCGPGDHTPLRPIVRSSAVFRPFCLPCFGYGVDYGQLIEPHPAGDRIECFDPFPVALPADKHQTGAFGKNSEH